MTSASPIELVSPSAAPNGTEASEASTRSEDPDLQSLSQAFLPSFHPADLAYFNTHNLSWQSVLT